jgi:hypothetical protein
MEEKRYDQDKDSLLFLCAASYFYVLPQLSFSFSVSLCLCG